MTMAYIRKAYGVPAKRGGRISYMENWPTRCGTILSARDARLVVHWMANAGAEFYIQPGWWST